ERAEIGFTGAGRGGESVITWGNWAIGVARVSDQGTVLFSESVPLEPEKSEAPTQPVWSLLRRVDRNAAQILGPGSAYDLSPGGRSALVVGPARKTLSAPPLGPGQSSPVDTHGAELIAARWFRDARCLVAICRAPSDADYRLFILPQDGSAPRRVAD